MADKSKIEWTEATWNPILGCDKISPGCKNCYAIRTAHRLQANPNPKVAKAFEGLTVIQGGEPNWTGRVNFVAERLEEPLRWRQPRRIFVNSQSDLFHEGVTNEQIAAIFGVMAAARQHTFQILTKRPERALLWFRWIAKGDVESAAIRGCTLAAAKLLRESFAPFVGPGARAEIPWPLPNVWLGVSCESPKYKDRIDLLRETPGAVRMLSLEPLLEDLGVINLEGIHWVIVGGESGPNARPMHPDWARSLRDQCKAAGVPFFFKQWGGYKPFNRLPDDDETEAFQITRGGVMLQADVRGVFPPMPDGTAEMVRVGKKAAGRLLDGKEHSEYPVTPKEVEQSA